MPWTALTLTDLHRYLAAPQVEALQTVALASDQADPLPELIADVTARLRAEVRACPHHPLSADSTLLPPELKSAAAALVIEAAQARLPTLQLTSDQVRAADNARRLLQRVAQGTIALALPAEPESPSTGPQHAVEVLRSRAEPLAQSRLQAL